MKFNISESDNGTLPIQSPYGPFFFWCKDSVCISAVQELDLTAVKINCSYSAVAGSGGGGGGGGGANQINMSNWQKRRGFAYFDCQESNSIKYIYF